MSRILRPMDAEPYANLPHEHVEAAAEMVTKMAEAFGRFGDALSAAADRAFGKLGAHFVTTSQAAELLGCSPRTVRRRIGRGQFVGLPTRRGYVLFRSQVETLPPRGGKTGKPSFKRYGVRREWRFKDTGTS